MSERRQRQFVEFFFCARKRQFAAASSLAVFFLQRISCLTLSADAREFVACGTIEGSVYCFETTNLECVYASTAKER